METNIYKCFCMASVHRLFLIGVVTLLFVLKPMRKSAPSRSGLTECRCFQALFCLVFSHLFLTWCHMAWRIGMRCFWSIPLLGFFSQSTSLHQMRTFMFLLQYHSISLRYLRERTRNKEMVNIFQKMAQNVNNVALDFSSQNLSICFEMLLKR